jgi:hypothetical protein
VGFDVIGLIENPGRRLLAGESVRSAAQAGN